MKIISVMGRRHWSHEIVPGGNRSGKAAQGIVEVSRRV